MFLLMKIIKSSVTWCGSHVGKKEKLLTSLSLKQLQGKKIKLGTCQILPMGNEFDFVFDDIIGGLMMMS